MTGQYQKLSALISLWMALTVALTQTVQAQGQRIAIIRDVEIEALVRDYARPILRAAGVNPRYVDIVVTADKSFNAFVADGTRIFINAGAIEQTKVPNELIGIIAHETGHLAGGHLARVRQAVAQAQALAVLTTILGAGAVVAGAATGQGGAVSAGLAGAASGGAVARRSFLTYARSEERAADRAAVKYLKATKQSGAGMLTVFERFGDQALFSARYADPYAQSHPFPRDRLSRVKKDVESSPYFGAKDPERLVLRHKLVQAKLAGFTKNARQVQRAYPRKDKTLPARYARAISAYRFGRLNPAIRQIDALIRDYPDNPHFHALKGQAYFEGGRPEKAIAPMQKAVQLSGGAPLFQIDLGAAMIASENRKYLDAGIQNLRKGLTSDPGSITGFRFLARGYAEKGDTTRAQLATALGSFISGDIKGAKVQAKRAQANLKRGSPEWLQAEDILTYKPLRLR